MSLELLFNVLNLLIESIKILNDLIKENNQEKQKLIDDINNKFGELHENYIKSFRGYKELLNIEPLILQKIIDRVNDDILSYKNFLDNLNYSRANIEQINRENNILLYEFISEIDNYLNYPIQTFLNDSPGSNYKRIALIQIMEIINELTPNNLAQLPEIIQSIRNIFNSEVEYLNQELLDQCQYLAQDNKIIDIQKKLVISCINSAIYQIQNQYALINQSYWRLKNG